MVRTESKETAATASAILDRLGLSIVGKTPLKMKVSTRQVEQVAFVDVSGRITVGEGNVMLREETPNCPRRIQKDCSQSA